MRRTLLPVEFLEARRCLTVVVSEPGSDLLIQGDADGTVEVVAISDDMLEVRDNGVVVGTFDLPENLRIQLEDAVTNNADNVQLDLANAALDWVHIDLGDGDDALVVNGGEIRRNLAIRGGDGPDNVSLNTQVDGRLYSLLGDSNDTVQLDGTYGSVTLYTADGNDTVRLESGAVVDYVMRAYLGDGDNQFEQLGRVDGFARVVAGDGRDDVSFAQSASIERRLTVGLGSGTNDFAFAGQLDGQLTYFAVDGDDSLQISDTAIIGGDVYAKLGDGNNDFQNRGTIDGDLTVLSQNSSDNFSSTGTVSGESDLAPGGENTSPFPFFSRVFNRFQRFFDGLRFGWWNRFFR